MKKLLSLLTITVMLLHFLFTGDPVMALVQNEDLTFEFSIENSDGVVDYFLYDETGQRLILTVRDQNNHLKSGLSININGQWNAVEESAGVYVISGDSPGSFADYYISNIWKFNIRVNITGDGISQILEHELYTTDGKLNPPSFGWKISLENYEEVYVDSKIYYCYRLYGPSENGTLASWLIYDEHELIPAYETYKKAAQTAVVSEMFKNQKNGNAQEFLDLAISEYRQYLSNTTWLEVARRTRDTGASVLGVVVGSQVPVNPVAPAASAKKIFFDVTKDIAESLAKEFIIAGYAEIDSSITKDELRKVSKYSLEVTLDGLEKASSILKARNINDRWYFEEAEEYYLLYSQGVINCEYYSNLIEITLPEVDFGSQLEDILVNFSLSFIGDLGLVAEAYDLAFRHKDYAESIVNSLPGYQKIEEEYEFYGTDFYYMYEEGWTEVDTVIENAKIIMNTKQPTELKLNDLKVGGQTISGFSSDKTSYTYHPLPYLSSIPNIEATASNIDSQVIIAPPSYVGFPGTVRAEIYVKDNLSDAVVTYEIGFPCEVTNEARLDYVRLDGRGGENYEGFSSDIYDYTINMTINDDFPQLYGITRDYTASIETIQPTQVPGTGKIIVTAGDGVSKTTYNFNYQFSGSDNNKIGNILIDGEQIAGFKPDVLQYYYKLPQGSILPEVEVIPQHTNAVVLYTNATKIQGGITHIKVVAENGEVATHWINWNYLPYGEEIIEFPDPVLEKLVREKCGIDYGKQILKSDLAGRTSLSLHNYGELVTSLEGIEHLVDLESVDFEGHEIDDITGMGKLTKLNRIRLSDNNIGDDDMAEFEILVNLVDVEMDKNQISDISTLANCMNLEKLSLRDNQIDSVEPLRNTAKLYELFLGNNYLYDYSPLYSYYKNITARDFAMKLSNNANLSDLQVNGETVTGFSKDTYVYYVELPENSPVPIVSAAADDSKSSVSISNPESLPGQAEITVTADDDITTHTYKIVYSLDTATYDTRLMSISINGTRLSGFDPDVYNYNLVLPSLDAEPEILVEKLEQSANAQIISNGTEPGIWQIVVTQFGAMTSTYTINIDEEVPYTVPTGTEVGNTSGNNIHGGEYILYDGWIYFIADANYNIYKMSLDGTSIERICDKRALAMNIVDGWIYFESSDVLYRVRIDGKGFTEIVELDRIGDFYVVGDQFIMEYRPDGYDFSTIYKINVNGDINTLQEICSDKHYEINIAGDYIYYINNTTIDRNRIFRVKTDGSGREAVTSEIASELIVDNDWIYFVTGYNMYRMRTDGSMKTQLTSGQEVAEINVYGSYIFYTIGDADKSLYMMNLDGSNKVQLTTVVSDDPQVAGDWIFYQNEDAGNVYYKIRIDGTGNSLDHIVSMDARLMEIKLNGSVISGFNPNIFEYTVDVSSLDLPKITYTSIDPNAIVSSIDYSGSIGDNTIKSVINVAAENGAVLTYTINYNIDLSNVIINFTDNTLEELIRREIDKYTGPLLHGDVAGITSLDISGYGITSLDGLQYFENLVELRASNNAILSASELSQLSSLEKVIISGNNLSNINFVSNLSNLQHLNVNNNIIQDISPLQNLSNLYYLDLGSNDISTLPNLSANTNLTHLLLGDNCISDISNLGSLGSLLTLDLNNNQVSNISALSSLTHLITLFLGDNLLTDISMLSNNQGLRYLFLHDNSITSIAALSSCTDLIYLILDKNNISDVSALSNISTLKVLYVEDNPVGDYKLINDIYANLLSKDFLLYSGLNYVTNGYIIDHAGESLNSQDVYIMAKYPDGTWNIVGELDANGEFGVAQLPAGTCAIKVFPKQSETIAPSDEITFVVSNQQADLRDIEVTMNTTQVKGSVYNIHGTPYNQNAKIEVINSNGTVIGFSYVDSSGRYSLGGLPDGTHTLKCTDLNEESKSAPQSVITVTGGDYTGEDKHFVLSKSKDFNNDLQINMLDLVILAQSYGEITSRFDINEDGVVNLYDLVTLVKEIV